MRTCMATLRHMRKRIKYDKNSSISIRNKFASVPSRIIELLKNEIGLLFVYFKEF